MAMLVSLQDASDHLRRDSTDDDAYLTRLIDRISDAVMAYVGGDFDFLDSAGDVTIDSAGEPIGVPGAMQEAVLVTIGIFYTDRDAQAYREGQLDDRLGKMSLPAGVHWLLDPLREPRLA